MKPAPWRKAAEIMREYPLALLGGVGAALFLANYHGPLYLQLVAEPLLNYPGSSLRFFTNEIFMALFFGLAAKEISEAFLPGGSLSPWQRAINPLVATLGGVVGPVGVFFLANHWWGEEQLNRGWGIPTATDIALAWLGARVLFTARHPAVDFLLLLAIADDALGMMIIALFYGDSHQPLALLPLWGVVVAMAFAYMLRKMQQQWWPAYLLGPGLLAWICLAGANLHPALALVFIVPFMPHGKLEAFAQQLKPWVDYGLFFFAFANSGVSFTEISVVTWIVLLALLLGKPLGICLFALGAVKAGFPLPRGMQARDVLVAGILAGMGLTVALFVCTAAYTGPLAFAQGPAKMGALFSCLGFLLALLVKRIPW